MVEMKISFDVIKYFRIIIKICMFSIAGYGNITPQTVPGKVFVMTFSAIGIPLTAIIITSIGKRLSSFVTCLLMRKRCQERITRHRRDIQKGDKIDTFIETEAYENTVVKEYDGSIIPLIISTAILIVYILIGSIIYSFLTHVSYMDAIYMVFLSISTIGVGASLPSDSAYYIGSVIYILTGLTLLSMCVYAALQYNNVKPPTEPSERKENNANVEQ
ncbi:KCNK3 [Mytilus coruscus]|uniref:KCNK3 n=1 Tax=Mytilus coruscus TaxID=42192 RepID=A0A6J8E0C1_MYTCO|nr:KCNK3 [Mytilus coruscus]